MLSWLRVLSHERANPSRLPAAQASARVAFFFEQSLADAAGAHPEAWLGYSEWLASEKKLAEAAAVAQRAAAAMPGVLLLQFAAAEAEEAAGGAALAKQRRAHTHTCSAASLD